MRFGLSYTFNVFSPEKLAYFRLNITYLYEKCRRFIPRSHKGHKVSFSITDAHRWLLLRSSLFICG